MTITTPNDHTTATNCHTASTVLAWAWDVPPRYFATVLPSVKDLGWMHFHLLCDLAWLTLPLWGPAGCLTIITCCRWALSGGRCLCDTSCPLEGFPEDPGAHTQTWHPAPHSSGGSGAYPRMWLSVLVGMRLTTALARFWVTHGRGATSLCVHTQTWHTMRSAACEHPQTLCPSSLCDTLRHKSLH